MSGSLYACLTVPRFAVQEAARRLLHPADRPLVIVNGTSDRATVVDLSSAAMQRGIRPGMLVWAARRRCSTLSVAVHDPAAIGAASIRLTDSLVEHADDVRQERPGRWTFSLRGLGHGCSEASTIGAALRGEVAQTTGYCCSIGLAAWPMLARIAAEVATDCHEGIAMVVPDTEAAFLAPLPVTMLPGVGPQTATALERLGVTTVGQLAQTPPGILAHLCGSRGAQLGRAARGFPPADVTVIDTINATWQSRDEPLLEPHRLQCELYTLSEQVGRDLRARGTAAGTLVVDVSWTDGVRRCETIRWPRRCNLDRDLTATSRAVLEKLLRERRIAVVGLSIRALDLGPIQADLLDVENERGHQLQHALDGIKRRYGARAIVPAVFCPTRATALPERA